MILKDGEVRLATLADSVAIANLSRSLIEYNLPWSWRPKRVRQAILDAETNCVVITHNGDVTAFSISVFGEDSAHLNLLAVATNYQNRGLGTHLIRWQETVAETAGIRVFKLEVRKTNFSARRFYQQLGYRETQVYKQYYSNQEDALHMVHHL